MTDPIKIEPTSSGFGVIRPDIVDELRGFAAFSYVGKPMAREIDRAILLVRRAADEIERLRGEGEWEHGYSLLNKDGEPTGLIIPANAREGAREGEAYVRRRKAGPWEPVEGDGDGHDA